MSCYVSSCSRSLRMKVWCQRSGFRKCIGPCVLTYTCFSGNEVEIYHAHVSKDRVADLKKKKKIKTDYLFKKKIVSSGWEVLSGAASQLSFWRQQCAYLIKGTHLFKKKKIYYFRSNFKYRLPPSWFWWNLAIARLLVEFSHKKYSVNIFSSPLLDAQLVIPKGQSLKSWCACRGTSLLSVSVTTLCSECLILKVSCVTVDVVCVFMQTR